MWMPQYITNDRSTLSWVKAWCRQATSHYPNQWWWPTDRSMSCGVSSPLNTWRNNDVITLKRRHFDVITSKWRLFDVTKTPLLGNVFAGRPQWAKSPLPWWIRFAFRIVGQISSRVWLNTGKKTRNEWRWRWVIGHLDNTGDWVLGHLCSNPPPTRGRQLISRFKITSLWFTITDLSLFDHLNHQPVFRGIQCINIPSNIRRTKSPNLNFSSRLAVVFAQSIVLKTGVESRMKM